MVDKKCSGKCKEIKDLDEFSKDKYRKDGLCSRCKDCVNEYYKNNTERISKKAKEWRKNNKNKVNKIRKEHYQNNKEKILKQTKAWYLANKEKMIDYRKDYYKNNKEKINQQNKNRIKNSVQCKLSVNLRSRLYTAIKNNSKSGSAVKDLGCSIQELKVHLEQQFQSEMSWKNYGSWHIDHIKSLASFDLTKREELLKACHFSNLQPLWAKDNLSKGCRV